RVSEASLAQATKLLLPSNLAVLPVFLMMSVTLRDQLSERHLAFWCLIGLATELLSLAAMWRYRRERARGGTGLRSLGLIRASTVAVGAAWGSSLLVPNPKNTTLMLLFAVFAYGASAFAMLLTTSRTDLYVAFEVPLFITGALALALTRDSRLFSVGLLALGYLLFATSIHRIANRGALEAIEMQWRTEQLMTTLADEHQLLLSANNAFADVNARLAHQATRDPLTGLFNRRGAIDALDRALLDASETSPVGLLYLDLDRFKHINDSLGHRGGDQFIAVIADRLARSIDPGATAGRIGGDEFIAVLPNSDLASSMAIASRITSVLGQPIHAEGREVPSSVSIGVAVGPQHGAGASELLRHANAALHRAKGSGRNRIEVFDGSVRTELNNRVDNEHALRRALNDGDIVPFFQPEVDATTGQVVGAELLARWLRRDGVVVAAADFLQVAAQAGLLERMTDHVMQQARPFIRRLSTLGLPDGFRFRVNLAPRATERSWRESPLDILIAGIEPSLLTVDVTESAMIDDLSSAAANLASLRVRGVRVCLDDFARGVSSLSLLRLLPIDEVRIDRTSIDTITAHPHDRAIVRSIISLVREIGLTPTADGVETGAQADVLIALGCIRHQGHLYSRALPAEEFENFLNASMAERMSQANVLADSPTDDHRLWPPYGVQ
ncbi:MAG: EAL domain-containing protein, partial [Actinobacteria bacterium]|nr:EAL domain-containing protein [Actinomycetota bacterium]